MSDRLGHIDKRDDESALGLFGKNRWKVKHGSLPLQAELFLDAFNGADFQLGGVHGRHRLPAIEEDLDMGTLGLNERRALLGQPTLEFLRVHI